jgi:hypothetical protein
MSLPPDRPYVLDETGPDESFLVGTSAQLEAFARSILDSLRELPAPDDWHGVRASQPRFTDVLTDPLSEVVISGVVVVQSETDRRSLVNRIRANCGDPTVD